MNGLPFGLPRGSATWPLDKTNNANWATKHWNGQHRLLLVPQLLRFALFSKRPRPYCDLKHSGYNALQLACEPQR